ncbi:serine/threonine-protein phosphatase [Streptomyces sp. JH14]|uniref:PP2C family protein-serine/threonine phosphatase n=1 Tax=Streptomyces sp. JH14 TaxID=2793630 RepID=UPI0023F75372|nr:PP2C family protein-serine/threonine phosphatase [Streptomyces sp. JH14]MDF6044224.1 serine/threonine-protein phosphatase [Streptomyces sp. JH14]
MRWLPAAWIALVIVLSVLWSSNWAVGFLLIVLPALAAYALGPLLVAASTVVAIVLEAILASGHHHLFDDHHIAVYIATALVGITAIALATRRQRQEHHLIRANSVAEAMMRTLLRPLPRQVGHVLVAGLYKPSEVGTMVGGDLYDIRATKAGERAIIGDVRGKGLQAVCIVADILGAFREAAYDLGDLAAVAVRMERRLIHEAEEISDDELFVTAALVEYDALAHQITIINHGHIDPILISRGEVTALTGPPALPLGLSTLDGERPGAHTHRFTHGDVLLLVTDGIVEARNAAGAFYPLLSRLRHRFGGQPAPGPADVVDFLNTDLPRHTRQLHDDVAILAIGPHEHL